MTGLPEQAVPSTEELIRVLRTEGPGLLQKVQSRLTAMSDDPDLRLREASLYWRGALGALMHLIDSPNSPEAPRLFGKVMDMFTQGVDLWAAHAREKGGSMEAIELLSGLSTNVRQVSRGEGGALDTLKELVERAEEMAQA